MRTLKPVSALGLVLRLALQTSCGYTRKTTLPRDIQTICVNTFQNKLSMDRVYAYEPGMEIKITNAIIQRLERDGNLKVVPREKADSVLEGDFIGLDQEGTRFTGDRKSTRLNSSHSAKSRMPSSA